MSTLTSVDMNIDRSSTRLHAPPGGQSSICFGTYGQDENIAQPVNKSNTNNIYGGEIPATTVTKPTHTVSNNIYGTEETEEELEAKRAAARRPSNSQGMGSVMAPMEETTSVRRVRQAPGGTSSFTLG